MVRFEEQQRFRQPWLWLILVVSAAPVILIFGFGLYQQLVLGKPFGDRPASDASLIFAFLVTIVVLAGTLALMAYARLEVRVDDEAVHIRFRPFHLRGRRIALGEIAEAKARTYRPLAEYGGWGIRYGFSGMAYNVSGDEGVQLSLKNGKRILLGSQRSRELEAAILASR
jgi:hypothetical protein